MEQTDPRPELSRDNIIDFFLQTLPLPFSPDSLPVEIGLNHKHYCLAIDGDAGECICEAVMWAESTKADWKMAITLPRIGERGVRAMPEIEANVQRH
jgi:hypothetical protein